MTEEQNQNQNHNQDKREEIEELIIKLDAATPEEVTDILLGILQGKGPAIEDILPKRVSPDVITKRIKQRAPDTSDDALKRAEATATRMNQVKDLIYSKGFNVFLDTAMGLQSLRETPSDKERIVNAITTAESVIQHATRTHGERLYVTAFMFEKFLADSLPETILQCVDAMNKSD